MTKLKRLLANKNRRERIKFIRRHLFTREDKLIRQVVNKMVTAMKSEYTGMDIFYIDKSTIPIRFDGLSQLFPAAVYPVILKRF